MLDYEHRQREGRTEPRKMIPSSGMICTVESNCLLDQKSPMETETFYSLFSLNEAIAGKLSAVCLIYALSETSQHAPLSNKWLCPSFCFDCAFKLIITYRRCC